MIEQLVELRTTSMPGNNNEKRKVPLEPRDLEPEEWRRSGYRTTRLSPLANGERRPASLIRSERSYEMDGQFS
jgi:hypothetical protein